MVEEKKPRTSGSEFWVGKVRYNLDGCTEEEKAQIEAKMGGQAFNGKSVLIWLLQGREIVPTERNMVSGDKKTAGDFIKQFDAYLKTTTEAGKVVNGDFVKAAIEKNIKSDNVKKIVVEHYFPAKVAPVVVAPPVIEDFKWA